MPNKNEERAEQPETTSDDSQWELSYKGFKVKDRRRFFNEIKENGDIAAIPYMTRIIKRCPYIANPADEEAYDEMDNDQFGEALARVMNGINDSFRRHLKTV